MQIEMKNNSCLLINKIWLSYHFSVRDIFAFCCGYIYRHSFYVYIQLRFFLFSLSKTYMFRHNISWNTISFQ